MLLLLDDEDPLVLGAWALVLDVPAPILDAVLARLRLELALLKDVRADINPRPIPLSQVGREVVERRLLLVDVELLEGEDGTELLRHLVLGGRDEEDLSLADDGGVVAAERASIVRSSVGHRGVVHFGYRVTPFKTFLTKCRIIKINN